MTNTSACRIFREQLEVILCLPEEQQGKAIISVLKNAFGIENNESIPEPANSVVKLLKKTVTVREFSANYGGKRNGSGRKEKTAAKDYTAVNEKGFENTVPVKEQDNSIQTTSSSQEEYKEPWERQPEPFDPKKKEDADALLAVMTGMMSTKAGDVLVKPEGHIGWKDATLKEFCTERYPEEVRKKVLAWIAWNKTAGQTFKAQNFIKLMAKFAGRNPNEEMAAFMVFNESKTNRSRAV